MTLRNLNLITIKHHLLFQLLTTMQKMIRLKKYNKSLISTRMFLAKNKSSSACSSIASRAASLSKIN
jgi:hypothetical protein